MGKGGLPERLRTRAALLRSDWGMTRCPTVMEEAAGLLQEALDALHQWAAAERAGDETELSNAKQARDAVLARVTDNA